MVNSGPHTVHAQMYYTSASLLTNKEYFILSVLQIVSQMTTCIPELPCSLVNLRYICIRFLALSVYIQELSSEDQSSREAPIEDEAAAAALNFDSSAGVRDRFAWCRGSVGRNFSVRLSTCLHAKAQQPASVDRHRHTDTDTDTGTGRRQTCAHIILIKPN